jgi:Domain of unknown function (DUF6883)
MKLSNAERALVPRAKIVDYLLSPTHPDGSSKAAFFVEFGFSIMEWEIMAKALAQHARETQVTRTEDSPFGTRYVIEGIINAPDGRTPFIRTIWFIENGHDVPRFVTAYPLKESAT